MESLLFHTLSEVDLDWLFAVAKIQPLEPNQSIPQSPSNQIYLALGPCTIAMPHQHQENLKELFHLQRDGLVGTVPLLEQCFVGAVLQARSPCQILSIDSAQLAEKLIEDKAFAARFYQFAAMVVMQHLQALIRQFNLNPVVLYQINVKEASRLFADLQDGHLDWLIAVGQRQQLTEGQTLQQVYRPIEVLQIVLDGALSLGASTNAKDLSITPDSIHEVTRLGRGDVFGEMRSLYLNAVSISMPIVQVQTLRDTEILSIPHWRLAAKVLHDVEFALHYYRSLAQLVASKYHTILTELRFLSGQAIQATQSDRLLEHVAKAEANFEWMIQRIQSKSVIGGEIEWSFN